jgi:hypothetical protein
MKTHIFIATTASNLDVHIHNVIYQTLLNNGISETTENSNLSSMHKHYHVCKQNKLNFTQHLVVQTPKIKSHENPLSRFGDKTSAYTLKKTT